MTQQPPHSTTSVNDETQTSTSTLTDCTTSTSSNEHKVLVDAICSISDAAEKGECNIKETSSILSVLSVQHDAKQLETIDYERLKRFIDKAAESGLVFNDLNALYNYFIQESCSERFEVGNASLATSSIRERKEEIQTEADVKSAKAPQANDENMGENKGQFYF